MKTPLHSFFGKLAVVRLNAELHRIFASGLRTQINAELPDWIQLAPYGEWPTSERKDDGTPEAVQIFTKADGDALVKRFNALHRRIARLARLNSCKVYVGHPDFAPDIWPKRIELGDVVEVSADDDGLNGRIRWNDDAGEQLKKHGFPSVAWDTDEQEPGKERPVMLWSVGMTSRPNIKGVKSAINALPEDNPEPEPTPEPENTMITKIKKALVDAGLGKDDDSDDLIQTHIGNLISQMGQNRIWAAQEKARQERIKTALNADVTDVDAGIEATLTRINAGAAEVTTLNESITTLTAERDAARTARINAELSRLVETGRLTKAEADADGAESVRARLNADTDKTLKELNAVPSRLNTEGLKIGGQKPAIMDARDRMTRINAWTDDYMVKKGVGYDEAYKAAEAAPELKPLFEAMKAAAPAA
ncbi:phage protease [Prosthecobacter sp.]|jgi:phage I-like protein|uniref:phage protease n=1 Tax=Prosthecobacter sp. TaxID=1965333 RepID=UPI0037C7B45D